MSELFPLIHRFSLTENFECKNSQIFTLIHALPQILLFLCRLTHDRLWLGLTSHLLLQLASLEILSSYFSDPPTYSLQCLVCIDWYSDFTRCHLLTQMLRTWFGLPESDIPNYLIALIWFEHFLSSNPSDFIFGAISYANHQVLASSPQKPAYSAQEYSVLSQAP